MFRFQFATNSVSHCLPQEQDHKTSFTLLSLVLSVALTSLGPLPQNGQWFLSFCIVVPCFIRGHHCGTIPAHTDLSLLFVLIKGG